MTRSRNRGPGTPTSTATERDVCISDGSGGCRVRAADRPRNNRGRPRTPPVVAGNIPTTPREPGPTQQVIPEPPPISDEALIAANPIILSAAPSQRQQLIDYYRAEYVREYKLSRCVKPSRSSHIQPEDYQREIERICLGRNRRDSAVQAPEITGISVTVTSPGPGSQSQ